MKKSLLNIAVAATLGLSASAASAATSTFDWTGTFTLLDADGFAVANTSITARGANQYQTPITGTMEFDKTTGAGVGTVNAFGFFNKGDAFAHDVTFQAIGDGMGGTAGTLVMGNMLFDWNGNNSIPVSLVMDAAGFFSATNADFADGVLDNTDAAIVNNGAIPASDGTYVNSTWGYLGLGKAVMATTDWNTTLGAGCQIGADANFADNVGGGCMGVAFNGVLPLVADTQINKAQAPFDANYVGTGTAIGGNPMADGPFGGFNANFDVLTLSNPGGTANSIAPFCEVGVCAPPPAVPVPAAVWLFGSGLLGLVGVARRKKMA